jgi:multicomponent K+:H+ antiporter subunit D
LIESPDSWVVAPVLIPLATAALLLLLGGISRRLKAAINLFATVASLAVSVMLLLAVDTQDSAAAFGVYLPGNWPVPFGIVFVVDRFSALMVVLTGCVALAALMYSLALWHQAGVYFHALFQLQLMGLYGAFLTGDLFNLFVFFEVLLAASYALLLHGGGAARVRSGLHYVAINLMASLLFLIGVAVLYGVTGTLNMADMALKLHQIPDGDRGLLHAGAAILALAFLVKAALWPLNGWLPGAYTAASAPVAALFAILTKVGVYAVVRLWTLCFPSDAGVSALFGAEVLVWSGILTVVFGATGMLASLSFERLAAFSVITSAGILVAAMGFDQPALGTGALFYLASSTLAGCALFLLVELLDRTRQGTTMLATIDDGRTLPQFTEGGELPPGENLDENEIVLVGRAIPFALAFLGVTFAVCALIVAGLPPLSGFVSKMMMLLALMEIGTSAAWTFGLVLILSGLLASLALIRVGMRHFWSRLDYPPPRLRVIETLPVALLLLACVALVVAAEPVYLYMRATAEALHSPVDYIAAVLDARPVGAADAAPGVVP